mmetsp:Transcript_5349/g.15275  ORF Transcript_5349/g.15275 Transcript_5349/m.15275 type:complete len:231 (+) Transcript_5349:212-904(+)
MGCTKHTLHSSLQRTLAALANSLRPLSQMLSDESVGVATTLGQDPESVEVDCHVPPLGVTPVAVVVFYEVHGIPRHIQSGDNILDLTVQDLPKFELRIFPCSAPRQTILHSVNSRQHHLRAFVPLHSSHRNGVPVKLRLLVSIGYLVHGAIEHEEESMRPRGETVSTNQDLGREEVRVFAPELPEQAGVAVVPLLHDGIVFHVAIENHSELPLFLFVHPNVASSIVTDDR